MAKKIFDLNKKFVVLEVVDQDDFADWDNEHGLNNHYLIIDKKHIAVEKNMASQYKEVIKECNEFFYKNKE